MKWPWVANFVLQFREWDDLLLHVLPVHANLRHECSLSAVPVFVIIPFLCVLVRAENIYIRLCLVNFHFAVHGLHRLVRSNFKHFSMCYVAVLLSILLVHFTMRHVANNHS